MSDAVCTFLCTFTLVCDKWAPWKKKSGYSASCLPSLIQSGLQYWAADWRRKLSHAAGIFCWGRSCLWFSTRWNFIYKLLSHCTKNKILPTHFFLKKTFAIEPKTNDASTCQPEIQLHDLNNYLFWTFWVREQMGTLTNFLLTECWHQCCTALLWQEDQETGYSSSRLVEIVLIHTKCHKEWYDLFVVTTNTDHNINNNNYNNNNNKIIIT